MQEIESRTDPLLKEQILKKNAFNIKSAAKNKLAQSGFFANVLLPQQTLLYGFRQPRLPLHLPAA
jgi:hypothetical protein